MTYVHADVVKVITSADGKAQVELLRRHDGLDIEAMLSALMALLTERDLTGRRRHTLGFMRQSKNSKEQQD